MTINIIFELQYTLWLNKILVYSLNFRWLHSIVFSLFEYLERIIQEFDNKFSIMKDIYHDLMLKILLKKKIPT